MALTNNLRKQVDLPVWEWCRLAPAVSSGLSASCTADNSLYHVSFGRYIYYYQSTATLATTTGLTGFFRYDTVSDSYQALSQPPITNVVYTGMQFAGGQGYWGFVLGNGGGLNTLQIPGLTGKTLKGFDIRITSGTGAGQQRIVTDVADPVIWDNGTFTSANASPQNSQQDTSKNWVLNQWVGYQVRFVSSAGQSQVRKIIYNNSNTLVWGDVAKFAEDQWAYAPVTTIAGSAEVITAAGSMYQIESSVITVDTNWATVPDATSRFVIRGGGIWMISQGATYALQYYDVLADMWYIRNAGAATSPVQAIGTDGTIVNSGENATVWDRGVATGSQSTTTLQDTSKSWVVNQWAGYFVRIFSGTGENQYRQITSNTTNTLTVPTWTTITPDTTTRYFIESFDMGTISSINPVLPSAAITISSTSGVASASTITLATAAPSNCNGWYVSGTGITPTTTISSGQGTKTLTLSNTNAGTVIGTLILSPIAISATAASGALNAYTITTSGSVPANSNGWYISGTGISSGTTIVSGQGTTSLTLSAANIATVSGTLYLYPVMPRADVFSAAATGSGSSTTITLTTLASPVNCQGWFVSGTGVANGAIVTAGQGTTSLTVSIANAGAVSGNITISPTILSGTAASGVGGANTITVNDTTPPFCNGWYISGTGIATGTTIVSGQNTTSLTLSANNTGTVSGTLTYSLTPVSAGTINGSVFTAGATTGIYYPGQVLLGTGTQATKTIVSAPAECYTTGTVTTVNFAVSNPITLGIQVGMIASINSLVGLPGQAGSGALAAAATGPNYVTAVSSNTITLSTAVATALVNTTLQFTTGWCSTNAAHTASGSLITLASGNTTGLYPGMYLFIGGGLTGTLTAGTYVAQVIDATRFTVATAPAVTLGGTGWLFAQGYQTVIQRQLSGVPGGAGTYMVFPSQQVSSASIIGTGVSVITDTTKSWPANRWTNYAVRIRSGTGMGQMRQVLGTASNGLIAYTSAAGATNVGATITVGSTTNLAVNQLLNVISGTGAFAFGTFVQSITNSTTFIASAAPTTNLSASAVITGTPNNTLIVYPAWTTLPDATSVYAIHGDSDKNYFSMAAQTPTFIHNIEADTVTTGRQLDRGVARGVSAQLADYEPVAVSSGVPVLQITGGTGYIAGVATVSGSTTANVATVTYSTAVASAIFPIGSWVTIAGTTPAAYVGTWQVINSSVGSVSFYLTGAPGAISVQGTIGQAASFNLAVGTLAAGNWMQIGNATTLTVTGCVPATFNGALTVAANVGGGTSATFGGYQATGVSGSSTSTFSVSSTVGLVVGAIPTVTAGSGSFPAGTYIVSFVANTSFTINTTATLSGATVTVVPSVAVTSSTAVGNLVTLGVARVAPKASTAMAGSAGTVTVTVAAHVFPVGSWVVVTGAVPGTYNGIFQVTGGTPGTNVTYANATTVGATTQCLIGPATQTLLVTTVNNHIFQTGQVLSHKGDQGWTAAINNIAAPITVMTPAVGTSATQYIYATNAPSAQMVVYTYSATVFTTLCDGAKNWVPNQWAGCQVSFNTTQLTAVATPVQPTILSCYILANTSNTLIFAAANTVAPIQGVSRYVITAPASFGVGSIIGGQDYGLMQGVQSATSIQDVTKSWIMPAPTAAITATTISNGVNTCVITGSMNGILIGMTVVVSLGNTTLAAGTVVSSISGTTLTLSNNFVGAGTTASLIFAPTASSSGTTVTVTGYPLVNLAPGMKLAMTATTNMSSSVLTTGAFVLNGGVNFTPVTVVSITSPTTFTISQAPVVPLQNATVQATFWVPGQWVNRRLRVTSGSVGANTLEGIVSANTTNTLTIGTITTVPVSGQYGYAILQQPVIRGLGTQLYWNYGASNLNTNGRYLYQPRGGNLAGWDRINLSTDKWEFLMPTPSFEPANTGFMSAYDGGDRIYFTVQVTQRVYYLDIESNVIHSAGMYPYVAGTAVVGNRMEIFQTQDGLKYLWLNRHSFQECFRQLLWY